jgi:hypothetical protein
MNFLDTTENTDGENDKNNNDLISEESEEETNEPKNNSNDDDENSSDEYFEESEEEINDPDSDDDIYNSELDEDTKINYFILNNIYKKLCINITGNKNLKYNRNYCYLSKIPDLYENNESMFYKYPSEEYKLFITNKINDYINNKQNYIHKPAIIILLKLCANLRGVQSELFWLYNSVIRMVNFMDPDDLFMNVLINKKGEPNLYDELYIDYVLGSTIIPVGEGFKYSDDFYKFILKMFQLSKDKYPLLLDEFGYIDKHYDLSNDKYNNLKYILFYASLYQFLIIKKVPFDFTYFFDVNNPPTSQSIKFPIFLAWLIGQKRKNIYYDVNLINIVNTDTCINKFYKSICYIEHTLFNDIVKKIQSPEVSIINNNRFNINEIFDENKNIISNKDDYEIINEKHNDEIINEYNTNTKLITVYGGGNKIPINTIGKFIGYLYYIE